MAMRDGNYLSFSAAAKAAGVPEKHLENWIERRHLHLDADDRAGGGWRRFSELDAIRIASVARLKAFGWEKDEAAEALESLIIKVCSANGVQYYGTRDNAQIIKTLRHHIFVFFYFSYVMSNEGGPEPMVSSLLINRRKDKKSIDAHIPDDVDSWLVIDMAKIIDGVYQRLSKLF